MQDSKSSTHPRAHKITKRELLSLTRAQRSALYKLVRTMNGRAS